MPTENSEAVIRDLFRKAARTRVNVIAINVDKRLVTESVRMRLLDFLRNELTAIKSSMLIEG